MRNFYVLDDRQRAAMAGLPGADSTYPVGPPRRGEELDWVRSEGQWGPQSGQPPELTPELVPRTPEELERMRHLWLAGAVAAGALSVFGGYVGSRGNRLGWAGFVLGASLTGYAIHRWRKLGNTLAWLAQARTLAAQTP